MGQEEARMGAQRGGRLRRSLHEASAGRGGRGRTHGVWKEKARR